MMVKGYGKQVTARCACVRAYVRTCVVCAYEYGVYGEECVRPVVINVSVVTERWMRVIFVRRYISACMRDVGLIQAWFGWMWGAQLHAISTCVCV